MLPITDTPTALQSMMKSAGLWNTSQPTDPANAVFAVESVLSLAVVNGLARRDYGADFSGTLKDNPHGLERLNSTANQTLSCSSHGWCEQFMPPRHRVFGNGQEAFDVSPAEKQSSTRFTMQANSNGYAYSAKGPSAKFALGALLAYVAIALLHILFLISYKESSSSWGSISELVALAMNSTDEHETFDNTGAGIESFHIFKEQTQVVVRNGQLRLAVGTPSEGEGRTMVKPNELYG
ncbi:hypothetical protein P7C71_g4483, partial [Lecanoromycetidae sp. Uapishka_2]